MACHVWRGTGLFFRVVNPSAVTVRSASSALYPPVAINSNPLRINAARSGSGLMTEPEPVSGSEADAGSQCDQEGRHVLPNPQYHLSVSGGWLGRSSASHHGGKTLQEKQEAMLRHYKEKQEIVSRDLLPHKRLNAALKHCTSQEEKARTPAEQLQWLCFAYLLREIGAKPAESKLTVKKHNIKVGSETIETLRKREVDGELTVRCRVRPVELWKLQVGITANEEVEMEKALEFAEDQEPTEAREPDLGTSEKEYEIFSSRSSNFEEVKTTFGDLGTENLNWEN
jgi:hypothetical protein